MEGSSFKRIRLCSILFSLTVLLKIIHRCDSRVVVSLRLGQFINPGSRLRDGSCCNALNGRQCGLCHYEFQVCISRHSSYPYTQSGEPHCDYGQWNTGIINPQTDSFYLPTRFPSGHPNPLKISVPYWEGRVRVTINVRDVGSWGYDDHLVIEYTFYLTEWHPARTEQDISWHHWLFVRYGLRLDVQYAVHCERDYYGKMCRVHCRPPTYYDRYTCDTTTGQKICNRGYTGSECRKKLLPTPNIWRRKTTTKRPVPPKRWTTMAPMIPQTTSSSSSTTKTTTPTATTSSPTPTVDTPTSTMHTPASTTDTPTSKADTPTSTTDTPISTTDIPTSKADTPTSTTDVPTSTVDTTISTTDTPTATTDAPTTTDTPTATTDAPTTTDTPTSTADTATSTTDVPTSKADTPTSTTDAPTSTADTPTSTTDAPTSTTDTPISTTDTLTSTADTPAFTTDVPTSTSDSPTSTTDTPTFTTDTPTSTTDVPTTADTLTSTTDATTSTTEAPTTTDTPTSITDTLATTTDAPTSTTNAPTTDTPTSTRETPTSTTYASTSTAGTPISTADTPTSTLHTPTSPVGTPTSKVNSTISTTVATAHTPTSTTKTLTSTTLISITQIKSHDAESTTVAAPTFQTTSPLITSGVAQTTTSTNEITVSELQSTFNISPDLTQSTKLPTTDEPVSSKLEASTLMEEHISTRAPHRNYTDVYMNDSTTAKATDLSDSITPYAQSSSATYLKSLTTAINVTKATTTETLRTSPSHDSGTNKSSHFPTGENVTIQPDMSTTSSSATTYATNILTQASEKTYTEDFGESTTTNNFTLNTMSKGPKVSRRTPKPTKKPIDFRRLKNKTTTANPPSAHVTNSTIMTTESSFFSDPPELSTPETPSTILPKTAFQESTTSRTDNVQTLPPSSSTSKLITRHSLSNSSSTVPGTTMTAISYPRNPNVLQKNNAFPIRTIPPKVCWTWSKKDVKTICNCDNAKLPEIPPLQDYWKTSLTTGKPEFLSLS